MFRSTLSVSAALAVIAAVLASLWIGYGPRLGGQEKHASAVVPLSQQQRSGLDTKGQPIRTITPGANLTAGTTGDAPGQGTEMVASAPVGSSLSADTSRNQPSTPDASANLGGSSRQADIASNSSPGTEIGPGAMSNPSAATGGSIDLNTASVEQLNGLGAGMIGKRIIEFRPYASVEELLTRRVLKRADYDAIKSAATVR